MKVKNRMVVKALAFCFLVVNMLVSTTPAYAWTYSIKWGDTLYKLSRNYGAKVQDLKAANKLPSDKILAGTKIWIPDNKSSQKKAQNNTYGSNDLYLLARLINGEARGESFTGQVAVGAVILNRVKSDKFPNTIAGNIYQGLQFESVDNGQIWQPLTASAIKAAEATLNGWDPTGGALYFYNPAKVHNKYSWIWSRTIIHRIGNHVFAL
jgi:N-acetylmuramoyl-L-alanine amidase